MWEQLLAERGLDISYETARRWILKFGPLVAQRLRQPRPEPRDRWHLNDMVARINTKRLYFWRAVDHKGEVLDVLVQRERDPTAGAGRPRSAPRRQKEVIVFRLAQSESTAEWERLFGDLILRSPGWRSSRWSASTPFRPARRVADRLSGCPGAALSAHKIRNVLDELFTCARYKSLAQRKTVRTANAI
jgi:putative transposase